MHAAAETTQDRGPPARPAGRRPPSFEVWVAVSGLAHVIALSLLGGVVVSVPQPVRTSRPRMGPVVALETQPPEYSIARARVTTARAGPLSEGLDEVRQTPDETPLETRRLKSMSARSSHVPNVLEVHPPGRVFDDTVVPPEDLSEQLPPGTADAISDIPLGGTGVVGNIGVGGGGAGSYGNPEETGGPGEPRPNREDGYAASDHALDAAIRWLARNQSPDGGWGAEARDAGARVGATALAVMALLADGHTETSGRYAPNVRRGAAFLVEAQEADVSTGSATARAVAGIALAESARLGGCHATRNAAQREADATSERLRRAARALDEGRAANVRLDAVAWGTLALSAAFDAGLKVRGDAFLAAADCIDAFACRGEDAEDLFASAPGARPSPRATVAAKVALESIDVGHGFRPDGELLPADRTARARKDFASWYLATRSLCSDHECFWEGWCHRATEALVSRQRGGGPGDVESGSWDPGDDPTGEAWGRAAVTALGALTLECIVRRHTLDQRKWREETLTRWKIYEVYLAE